MEMAEKIKFQLKLMRSKNTGEIHDLLWVVTYILSSGVFL